MGAIPPSGTSNPVRADFDAGLRFVFARESGEVEAKVNRRETPAAALRNFFRGVG